MAYTAWSVVYGEQPTAAKWNQLGANDAGFKDGTNIDAGAITFAKLLSTIFSGQIQTYTNTGDGGGTGYYINLGGLKLCWGLTGSMTVAGIGAKNISLPVGFFANVRAAIHDKFGNAVYQTQQGTAPTTSQIQIYFSSGTGWASLLWIAIGT